MSKRSTKQVSRREFLRGTAAVGATALMTGFASHVAYAAASGTIKVGVIGCGGRGRGATGNCLEASKQAGIPVEIWACGDLWKDRAVSHGKKNNVPEERCFGGFDNYKGVLASGVDSIITAAPPGFRPYHFAAAIMAGKHVFMEKPVCVDPWGYNQVCTAADMAKEKKLTVVAGTQRRHEVRRQENLKRIHDGAMGDLVGGQCYWMGGPVTHNRPRGAGMTDIEWQCLNWYAWAWTCGDHIVEQHVHNIDMICWAFNTHPVSALGLGGRQVRPEPGNIFDHHAVEFEFPNGVRVASYCSHIPGGSHRVSERVVGTKGSSGLGGSIEGENAWKSESKQINPYVQEHIDCLGSITGKGEHWNEGHQVADSTMAAVLGRMCTYTGREIKWDWAVKASKLKLGPENMNTAFGPFTPPPPAVPGKTKLI
ncbi:MAG TPA: Gfo/Idh/MocA family oxidoreductase [Phycisphaerae bacterium]|nr:Gfo/Idh/MocA family oxidoreductase [Phycisphaerae bacterium]